MLWDIISRYRGSDSSGIDWPGLSAHLEVPLPFLMYRAQVRYEEDLRGLQGNLGASILPTPGTPRPTIQTKLPDKKPNSLSLRSPLLGLRTSQPAPLSRGSTPAGTPRNRLATLHKSPLGLQGSQMSPLLTSNSALLDRPASTRPLPSSPLTIRRPPTPPSPQSPASSSSENNDSEREKEENRQQVDRQLKQLEKMMSSQLLGFARPKTDGKNKEKLTLSMVRESQRSEDRTSSASSSIPSIPSPPPDKRAGAFALSSTPRGIPRNSAPAGNTQVARSPPHSPSNQVLRNKMLGKHTDRVSNQGSSASSFSDISDASVSTSALEDALTSNFRQGSTSRLSSFARGYSRPGPAP